MSEILQAIVDNRIYLVLGVFAVWIIYVLHHTGKLKIKKLPSLRRVAPTPTVGLPPEQRATASEAALQKAQREKERYALTIAKMKRNEMTRQIIETAGEKLTAVLPETLYLFDPENQLAGRPIYFLGNVPIINKSQALERLVDKHRLLSRISPSLTYKLMKWLYFQGDTAYFYSAQLLPNGKWVITATSKPATIKANTTKPPRYCKQFILVTSEHQKIDDLILNKWEVTHAKAALEISATILGPFPVEEFAKIYANTGWINNE